MLDPLLPLTVATGLALVFAMAAQHKFGGLKQKRFAAQLAAYELLPEVLVTPVARMLPLLELGIATALLLPLTREAATTVAVALLLLYGAAMAVNLLRGRSAIDCGCGDVPRMLSWWLVLRNVLLAALACTPLLPLQTRALQFSDFIFVLLLTLLAAIAWLAVDQLLRNHHAFNQQES